jgi:hypothetical protein
MTGAKAVPKTVTVHIPFRLVKRGGRKEMQLPDRASSSRKTDNTLIKALARAFRWKWMLESGEVATMAELAEHEGIAPSYMTRVLRLTLLAPDIVEAILAGTQEPEVTLARLLEPFQLAWSQQSWEFAAQKMRNDTTIISAQIYNDTRMFNPDEPAPRRPTCIQTLGQS